MADIKLSTGREIDFDLSELTLREYRGLLNPNQPPAEEDAIITRVTGLTQEEYLDLVHADWRRLWKAFFKKAREPIDPN